jgi:hypothetical protein
VTFTIRPSVGVDFTKASAIAIAGPSGSGKTESAMRLARGYCGSEKFVIIDTEEKRALYKKARYQPWDWIDFQPPFSPEATREVLELAKGYKAVILDSGSAEYAGEGGITDIQEDELERMSKGDPKRMEALVGPSWKNAKRRHKRVLMTYLIRYPTLLIICLRAEPKVKFIKVEKDGRMVNSIVDAGYQPICEKMFMYEMLVGCKMTADNAGVPEHIKQLEPDLEPVFLAGKQIDEQTGKRLAAWAAGGSKINGVKADADVISRQPSDSESQPRVVGAASSPTFITSEQEFALATICAVNHLSIDKLKRKIGVDTLAQIKAADHQRVVDYIDAQIKAKEKV